MNPTTLRGIFPEPKPAYRRNFIKENVQSIKQMQGMLQEAGVTQPKQRAGRSIDRFRSAVRATKSRESKVGKSSAILPKPETNHLEQKVLQKNTATAPKVGKIKATANKKESLNSQTIEGPKITHRAMQTEREEDLINLYDTGVIKYPSPSNLNAKNHEDSSVNLLHSGEGDHVNITDKFERLGLEEKDFIKENKQNMKPRPVKQSPVKVLANVPPTYQRGVLPKYLRDKKEEVVEENEPECPPGHILLPEEERKETLRVLRQSYADRIQELNMMPVRNDTLKMRKRKMEIEEELKRIDGGIKVFQRPKVFVKINA